MGMIETVKHLGVVQTVINKFWGKAYRNKAGVIQAALETLGRGTYLEIGVASGDCFSRIEAERKIAIDPAPDPRFHARLPCVALGQRHFPASLPGASLFAMTSDDFFAQYAPLFAERPIDVALIDGSHTYRQALLDVLHCLDHLGPRGVIVMHDCNPSSETIGYPAPSFEAAERLNLPKWNGHWSGDVWKTIVHLRSGRNDLHIFVLDCDMGVGIVTRAHATRRTTKRLPYAAEEIAQLCYHDLDHQRKVLLNLKHPRYFYDFLSALRS